MDKCTFSLPLPWHDCMSTIDGCFWGSFICLVLFLFSVQAWHWNFLWGVQCRKIELGVWEFASTCRSNFNYLQVNKLAKPFHHSSPVPLWVFYHVPVYRALPVKGLLEYICYVRTLCSECFKIKYLSVIINVSFQGSGEDMEDTLYDENQKHSPGKCRVTIDNVHHFQLYKTMDTRCIFKVDWSVACFQWFPILYIYVCVVY